MHSRFCVLLRVHFEFGRILILLQLRRQALLAIMAGNGYPLIGIFILPVAVLFFVGLMGIRMVSPNEAYVATLCGASAPSAALLGLFELYCSTRRNSANFRRQRSETSFTCTPSKQRRITCFNFRSRSIFLSSAQASIRRMYSSGLLDGNSPRPADVRNTCLLLGSMRFSRGTAACCAKPACA